MDNDFNAATAKKAARVTKAAEDVSGGRKKASTVSLYTLYDLNR